jgi:hypothetical protein
MSMDIRFIAPLWELWTFFCTKTENQKEGSSTTKQPKRSGDMIRSYSAVNQKKEKNYGV